MSEAVLAMSLVGIICALFVAMPDAGTAEDIFSDPLEPDDEDDGKR